jgi:hypothetical protein
VPLAAATNEMDEKTSRDKFITCLSLAGASGYQKIWKVENRIEIMPMWLNKITTQRW